MLLMYTDPMCPQLHICNTLLTHYLPNIRFIAILKGDSVPEHDFGSGNESLSVPLGSARALNTAHPAGTAETRREKKREDKRRKS